MLSIFLGRFLALTQLALSFALCCAAAAQEAPPTAPPVAAAPLDAAHIEAARKLLVARYPLPGWLRDGLRQYEPSLFRDLIAPDERGDVSRLAPIMKIYRSPTLGRVKFTAAPLVASRLSPQDIRRVTEFLDSP